MENAWLSVGAVFAFLTFLQNLLSAFLPREFSSSCKRLGARAYRALFSSHVDYIVEELNGGKINQLYDAVQLHLSGKAATTARLVRLSQPKNASALTCSLGEHERVQDFYKGAEIWWEFSSTERNNAMTISWRAMPDMRRSLHMRIHQKDRDKVMSGYLPHLLENAKALKLKRRDRFLYTNVRQTNDYWGSRKPWDSVPFKHPASFASLALDPALKKEIMEDLTDFANGEQFYKDAGRAWKRGYLLYGPPGTGKSSMIAAMANFLEYDVYDLELTVVKTNADLRKLLLSTSDKAIIVLEDIDCSLDLSERKKKKKKQEAQSESENGVERPPDLEKEEKLGSEVTLSGLLNFTDGLWSSCGSERIFIFTTNHIEMLDAALLRSGRMDMHIHLSYCGYEAFKVLAKNYLKLEEHALFEDVRAVMQEEGVRMTPADVSEVMTREKRDGEKALRCLIERLRESKVKKELKEGEEEGNKGIMEMEEQEREGTKELAMQQPIKAAEVSGSASTDVIELKEDIVLQEDGCNDVKDEAGAEAGDKVMEIQEAPKAGDTPQEDITLSPL